MMWEYAAYPSADEKDAIKPTRGNAFEKENEEERIKEMNIVETSFIVNALWFLVLYFSMVWVLNLIPWKLREVLDCVHCPNDVIEVDMKTVFQLLFSSHYFMNDATLLIFNLVLRE